MHEIQMTKTGSEQTPTGVSVIRIWSFVFVSDFGFRISSFLFLIVLAGCGTPAGETGKKTPDFEKGEEKNVTFHVKDMGYRLKLD